jgi:putative transposase
MPYADCLKASIRTHGKPEIFNSDQGSQFTSDAFTGVLQRERYQQGMTGHSITSS